MTNALSRAIGEKRQYRQYRARVAKFPAPYRTLTEALERYLMYFGALTNGEKMLTMLADLADLVEQSATDGVPVRGIVGDDPVEFAETFVRNYADAQWINKERERLTKAVDLSETQELP